VKSTSSRLIRRILKMHRRYDSDSSDEEECPALHYWSPPGPSPIDLSRLDEGACGPRRFSRWPADGKIAVLEEDGFYSFELLTLIRLGEDRKALQMLVSMLKGKNSDGQAEEDSKRLVNDLKGSWYAQYFYKEKKLSLFTFAKMVEIADQDDNIKRRLSPDLPLLDCYLNFGSFTQLNLDNCFRDEEDVTLPLALFKCCPQVLVLTLRSNGLRRLPADVARLKKLVKLALTGNRLTNTGLPHALKHCRQLQELYLDHNLLDALPGFLLALPQLKVVRRHGNHNYFKATFMFYHTDVHNRVLREPGETRGPALDKENAFPANSLQELAALKCLQGDIFDQERVPPSLQSRLAALSSVRRWTVWDELTITIPFSRVRICAATAAARTSSNFPATRCSRSRTPIWAIRACLSCTGRAPPPAQWPSRSQPGRNKNCRLSCRTCSTRSACE